MEFGSFKAPSWRGISYGQTSDDQTTEDRIEIWGLKERDNQTVRLEEGIWGRSFEIWKYEDKQNIPLQRNLGSPIARHAQWVRCLHGLRPLLYEVDGTRHTWVSRHFCPIGNFLESWVSLWFSAYADFFTFPEKVEGRKAVPFLNFGIPFLHFLWPSWKYMEYFLSNRGPFHAPLLYKYREKEKWEVVLKKFSEIFRSSMENLV